MNYLYIDTEYSNFNVSKGDIIQLSIVPVIETEVQEPFNQYIKPEKRAGWTSGAEKVHGISWDMAQSFDSIQKAGDNLKKYIEQFDCVFTAVGWNCRNDQDYLENLLRKGGVVNEWHLAVRPKWTDILPEARKLNLKSHTLSSVAKHFGIEIKAHDSLSDARATHLIHENLKSKSISKYEQVQMEGEKRKKEVRKEALDSKYVQISAGTIYISEYATEKPEIMAAILDELWSLYVES